MNSYEGNKQRAKEYVQAFNAGKGIVSQDLDERNRSRNFAGNFARNVGGEIDFNDPVEVDEYLSVIRPVYQEYTLGYFKEHRDTILRDAPIGDLVGLLNSVTPTKNGDATHDDIVGVDLQRRDILKIIREVGEGERDYSEVFNKTIKPYVESRVNERLSQATREDNKYLKEDTKKAVRGVVLSSIGKTAERGMSVLGELANEAINKFNERLPNDSVKAAYVGENIKAISDKGDQESLQMALLLAGIKQQ